MSNDTAWRSALEQDLAVAIAMARASTVALLNLSQLSHREICAALDWELQKIGHDLGEDSAAIGVLKQMVPPVRRR